MNIKSLRLISRYNIYYLIFYYLKFIHSPTKHISNPGNKKHLMKKRCPSRPWGVGRCSGVWKPRWPQRPGPSAGGRGLAWGILPFGDGKHWSDGSWENPDKYFFTHLEEIKITILMFECFSNERPPTAYRCKPDQGKRGGDETGDGMGWPTDRPLGRPRWDLSAPIPPAEMTNTPQKGFGDTFSAVTSERIKKRTNKDALTLFKTYELSYTVSVEIYSRAH